jgi:hypothetical protein
MVGTDISAMVKLQQVVCAMLLASPYLRCVLLQCASQAIAAVLELYAAADWAALR